MFHTDLTGMCVLLTLFLFQTFSFPSGHASFSAAGLLYLSLFLASKFAVTIPIILSQGAPGSSSHSAFPSRLTQSSEYPKMQQTQPSLDDEILPETTPSNPVAARTRAVASIRRQAAAPPLYLLAIILIPGFAAIFIASSRWFDFRHHGFDILSGSFIGIVAAISSFRYYHLPVSRGAGWAWGPRSTDKALWAGVGSYSYATGADASLYRQSAKKTAS
jgi:hypothetical protein